MPPVGAANGRYRAARTVRVAGIESVSVLGGHVVVRDIAGEQETSFAVGHPDAELHPFQRGEHDGVAVCDFERQESRLEFVRHVVVHGRFLLGVRFYEAEFHHELATVADTERECVFAGIEAAQGFACLLVVEETAGPSFGGTEHVGVGETAAEDYHVHVVEGFAAAGEVGHVHILHVESGQIEGVGHFAVAVHTLFADYGAAYARFFGTVEAQAEVGEASGECVGDAELDRLAAVIPEAFEGAFLAALVAVEKVGGTIPEGTHGIDVELCLGSLHRDAELAFAFHGAYLAEPDVGAFQNLER